MLSDEICMNTNTVEQRVTSIEARVRGLEKAKRWSFGVVSEAFVGVLLCAGFRFIPPLNFIVSGPLERMRWITLAITSAIEDPATPFRVPVGQDAEMILGLRRSLDDQAFEHAMRKAIGLTW
jgi:hypothetical protein